MSVSRLIAIAVIWIGAAAGWAFLADVIGARTQERTGRIEEEVATLWGGAVTQRAPTITYPVPGADAAGRPALRREAVLPVATRIRADLHLDPRRRGLLWYSTYSVDFDAAWRIANPLRIEQNFTVRFEFPNPSGLYDNFSFAIGEEPYQETIDPRRGLETALRLKPGEAREVRVRYKSQGLDRWTYAFADGGARLRDFELALTTDFAAIDFPLGGVSPGRKERTPEGWRLTWKYDDLLAAANIGLVMPQELNPGPLAAEIVTYAPLSLLFWFAVVVVLAVLRGVPIHPMNFLFVAAAFFAFHLLFAYLVDHLSIHAAFGVAAAISLLLVAGYLRLAVGAVFALREAAAAQAVFLVLFASSFFFPGFTGLAVTLGSVATLAVLMAATGRVRWEEVFGRPRVAEAA
ncbi:MAG: inner membrane CreD family protein [Planctomycetes bacterium]|nr:inner membrane CreD family protein [Planctomycetota bacterium]